MKQNKKQNAADTGSKRPTALLPAAGCSTTHHQDDGAEILA